MTDEPANVPVGGTGGPAAPGDDYLWDRSGPPDGDVRQLEEMLAPYRFKGAGLPDAAPRRASRLTWRRGFAIAAVVALTAAGVWYVLPQAGTQWEVSPLAGAPVLGERSLSGEHVMAAGEWLRTDEASRARISMSGLGWIDVDADSQIQLVRSGQAPGGGSGVEHRLYMPRGAIDVFVSAPPRVFFVDTPVVTAVDYGCEYTLETDEGGEGVLRVRTGLVKLVRREGTGQREASVYSGMSCRILPGSGPGTPFRDEAGPQFRADLATLDERLAAGQDPGESMGAVLSGAVRADAITLWHLLPRVQGDQRGAVYDTLAAFVPPPRAVTRERIMSLDERALDMWSYPSFNTR